MRLCFKSGNFVAQRNFVLMLTHRRGGIVIGVSQEATLPHDVLAHDFLCKLFSEASLQTWQYAIAAKLLLIRGLPPVRSEPFPVWVDSGFVVAKSPSTTAEYLSNLYSTVVAELGLVETEVENVCVTVGPGSFTGLRIGCAFANGLSRGRPRSLWGLPCVSQAIIRDACISLNWYEDWKNDFEVIERGQDESFAPVGLLDAVACIGALGTCETRLDEILHPRYGKEPGPVIKLREQMVRERENTNG